MAEDWQALTTLTGGEAIVVERVRLTRRDVAIEGRFELPPLARLSGEDQVFVAAFVRAHGSIKEMEALFGVSYPTVKNRLNRLAAQLDFVGVSAVTPAPASGQEPSATAKSDVLDRLERGEISVDEAVKALRPSDAAAPAGEPEKERS
ncbi:MAG: DUF2089 domain-containing protein [Acidobacteriota bacterium]|nr:DUF2089 domain-containing protein [Acidobacteriota bacterium]